MKVAIYSGTIPATTFVEHLIRGLAEQGIEVYIFGKVKKPYRYESKHVHVFPVPEGKLALVRFVLKSLVKVLLTAPQLLAVVRKILQQGKERSFTEKITYLGRILPVMLHPPDIFHIQWVKAIDDFMWLKTELNKKVVVSLRGAHINYSPLADPELAAKFRHFFPDVDVFHGVSRAIVKEAEKYNLDPVKAVVINPAVDEKLLLQVPKTNFKARPLQILSVGRFHWKKGYDIALDALNIAKGKGVDFIYTIIAGGNYEEILFQVNSLGLQENVKIIEGLPHHEVLQFMRTSDVFLLPSVEEGIANVVLEAMGNGIPVISTDCGGMAEVLVNRKNGLLVPVRDPDAIAAAVIEFTELSDASISKMIEEARETIRTNHVLSNQIASFMALYTQVIAPISNG